MVKGWKKDGERMEQREERSGGGDGRARKLIFGRAHQFVKPENSFLPHCRPSGGVSRDSVWKDLLNYLFQHKIGEHSFLRMH